MVRHQRVVVIYMGFFAVSVIASRYECIHHEISLVVVVGAQTTRDAANKGHVCDVRTLY